MKVFFLTICGNMQIASMASKFEVARFDGTENFELWQTRVKDLLAQQSILRALNEKKPAKVNDDKWEERCRHKHVLL